MRRSTLAAVLALLAAPAAISAQHPAAPEAPVEGVDFRVYDGRGHSRSFADILAAMDDADALLVGEDHDDVVGHRVEAQILIRARQRFGAIEPGVSPTRQVVLSLEMFERDIQYILDEYLSDLITEDQLQKSARPWPRYDTDYRRMVEFARAHRLPVVAANAPRRYVNRVSRLGASSLDELSELGKAFLPPLPYPAASEEYTRQWDRLMAEMMGPPGEASDTVPEGRPAAPTHDSSKELEAQALWDAAMGHAVASALNTYPGALVVHYAGSFHVERETGIPERVPEYRPGTRVVTVVLQPSAEIDEWDKDEYNGLGDFVVLTLRPQEEPEGS
ncbi:MAG TPA: ChaN family lipoprotein [Longimicrobiales bacterium]|nr:ChaN family lipoprotein [Longimicrobiales bacterium]